MDGSVTEVAATEAFGTLLMQLLLEVLGESTWLWVIWVVQGCEGVGDIPGIRGVQGGSVGSAVQDLIATRTQT